MDDFIRIRQLDKRFHTGTATVEVLRGLDLDVARGETLTILGVSGTGKSTLLNIIGGIDRPTRGQVQVAGVDIAGLSDRALTAYRRDHVGFVFQFYNLIPSLTARENIASALEAAGRTRREEEAYIDVLGRAVGLADKLEQFPEQLSGGEQQRVAIARALVKRPPLILADEPTGNLDPDTGAAVIDVLIRQVRETGATLIVITHNPAISVLTQRTLRLHDGRLE